MAIDKLPEFAKDGQKNTDDLVLTDGFPVLKKPARQWFNWLFNTVSLKINEIIDNKIDFENIVDNLTTDDATKPVSAKQAKLLNETKLSKSSNLSDLQNAGSARTNLGLGTAATRNVGTSSGNVLQVGAFGSSGGFQILNTVISTPSQMPVGIDLKMATTDKLGILNNSALQSASLLSLRSYPDQSLGSTNHAEAAFFGNRLFLHGGGTASGSNTFTAWAEVRSTANTTVDSNGFLKNASPIVELYADNIKLNDEAQQQSIEFEKLGVGDYLIKNSTGLSNDGWYIEQPKDANGNIYHAVVHEQLESGDISIKTYECKLNEIGQTVADLEKPIDIKENRFITLRLNELPQDTTAPQNQNVVDSEGNPAPSKYHVLESGIWVISDEDTEILAAEKYQAYLQSLKPLTRRQFKLALLENRLLDQIENSISAIGDDQTRARIQIEYAEATEFHRTSDSVAYMCQLLGLTDEQVDQMWEQALTL